MSNCKIFSTNDDLVKQGSSQVFWVNLTSTSTQSEIFDVTAISPNGWGVICDGNTIHISSARIEMEPGHLTTQKHDMRCEIIRESGEYSGDVMILINGSDSRIMHVVNQQVTWAKPTTEEGVSTMIVASGIGGFIALVRLYCSYNEEEMITMKMMIMKPQNTRRKFQFKGHLQLHLQVHLRQHM